MEKCGCVGLRVNNDSVIKYCPVHEATPLMLAALEMVQQRLQEKPGGVVAFTGDEWGQIDKAIAAARGQ